MCRESPTTIVATFVLFTLFVPAQVLLYGQAPGKNEDELIAVLTSGAELFEKAKACQRLATVGTAKAVSTLEKLLEDEKLAHYARFGLEPIPDPAVDAALRRAMGKLEGDLLVGVINSIGVRRDAEALSGLTKLLRGEDLRVASAAAAALGRIGTPEAAGVLEAALHSDDKELRGAVGDACLQCAESLAAGGKRDAAFALYDAVRGANLPGHLQMAGLRGAILARGAKGVPILVRNLQGKNEASFALALTVARELPGPEATSGIVGALATLPIERRALVIRALGDRRDRGALAAVLEAVGGPEEVRMEAVVALRQLGDASAVPVLLGVAAETEGEIGEAARVTLSRLGGEDVDRTIVAALDGASSARRRAVLIEIVGRRRIRSATPVLRRAAEGSDPGIRRSAIVALGRVAGLTELPFLIERYAVAKSREEADASIAALETACARIPDADAGAAILVEALQGASAEITCRLLGVFNAMGGDGALAAAAARAGDGDGDATVRECAIKVLAEWRTPDAAAVLLELARKAPRSDQRTRALKAVSDLIRRLGFPKADRLRRCEEAMEIAKSTEERKLVLHAYAGIPAPETLTILKRYYSDPELREAACLASVTIVERLVRTRRSAAASAMKDVLQVTKDKELLKRARRLYRQAGGKR